MMGFSERVKKNFNLNKKHEIFGSLERLIGFFRWDITALSERSLR
jgi:hypothetical protein